MPSEDRLGAGAGAGVPKRLAPLPARKRLATLPLAALPPLRIAGNHSTPWEQHTTGDGKQYYFNRATGETTWDRSRTLYPN